jgi:hypothetical protein
MGGIVSGAMDFGKKSTILGLPDLLSGEDPNIQAPQVDDRLKKIRDAQIEQARTYRANLPLEKERQGELAGNDSRLALSQKLNDIKQNASSRGLLYSGLRQGAESGAAAQAGGDLAAQREAINQRLEGQGNAFDTQAIQTGMGVANQQQGMNDFVYNQALAQRQQKSQAMGGLGEGLGALAGSTAAKKKG